MLTKPCPAAAKPELPCIDPEPWHRFPGGFSNKTMLARYNAHWHPMRQILSHVSFNEASNLSDSYVEKLRLELLQKPCFVPIATMIIYCPPCTHLIDTVRCL